LVLTDLRLSVEYKQTDEETSKQLSDRHMAIGHAVLKAKTVLDKQNVGRKGQCLNSAFEKLREGMFNINFLFILLSNLEKTIDFIRNERSRVINVS